jgi:hypothetical protein
VELGATALDHITDNHFEKAWDRVRQARGLPPTYTPPSGGAATASGVPGGQGQPPRSRNIGRHRNTLPSPEEGDRERNTVYIERRRVRDDSLERQSETSERVLRSYQLEADDPVRPVDKKLQRESVRAMSQANGNAPPRPRSQPPRTRYYDDDDDSDYDERDGRRYRASGRGYEDRDDRDYVPYDREIVETERYRGVSNALVVSRVSDSMSTLATFC